MDGGYQPTHSATFPNHHLSLFGAQQQNSPASSTPNSPGNTSPTSPRSYYPHQLHQHLPGQVRQLRPPKSPLYVPAALRPTERPNKSRGGPITPPKSTHGSLENLETQALAHVDGPTSPSTHLPPAHDWDAGENLGPVTGEPTKEHWKADGKSPQCDSPACPTSFGLFNLLLLRRRHHCRHCGHIFCSEHSPHNVPLDQHARFHPHGIPSRACDTCHRHYHKWEAARHHRNRSHSQNEHGEIEDQIDEEDEEDDDDKDSDDDTTDQQAGPSPALTGLDHTSAATLSPKTKPKTRTRTRTKSTKKRSSRALISYSNHPDQANPNSNFSSTSALSGTSVPKDWSWSTF